MKTKDKSYSQEGIEIRRNKNKITRTPLRLASDERHSEHEVWLRPRQYLPAVSSTVDDLPGYFAIPPPETLISKPLCAILSSKYGSRCLLSNGLVRLLRSFEVEAVLVLCFEGNHVT